MSNVVTIKNLTPGMVITQITKQNGPVKIRKSGLVTSDAMVHGLAEMGVQELEIDPDQTVEIAPVTQHRTQTQALLRGEHDTKANFDSSLSEQLIAVCSCLRFRDYRQCGLCMRKSLQLSVLPYCWGWASVLWPLRQVFGGR